MRTRRITAAIPWGAMRSRMAAAVGCVAGVVALLAIPPGASAGTTERVSVDSAGNEQIGGSGFPPFDRVSISADGRFVAFASDATNLVPGDTNGVVDVFVHDRQTGTTQRVSVDSVGNQGDGPSFDPVISADGRFVAFASDATNLVPGDTNGSMDVFVRDRQTGSTERVSVDSAGNEGDGSSDWPSISPDGRLVAFGSSATNLVPGDTNGWSDVFVHDRTTGTTERVSVDSAWDEANGASFDPALSADGRFVAFLSSASNLVPRGGQGVGIYVRDRFAGTTERVAESLYLGPPSLSAEGRFVASEAFITIDVRDRWTGTAAPWWYGCRPAISADGRVVVFASGVSTVVPGDTNARWDVFVRDRPTGTTERVSVDSAGTQGNSDSGGYVLIDGCGSAYVGPSAISADGRVVAFWSSATNLVPGDTNGLWDVFVRDRGRMEGDTTPPVQTNGEPAGTLPPGTTQATLSLATNEDATCRYSLTLGVAYEAMTATFATTGGTAHTTTVGGLSNGGSYRFYVRCQDGAGNANPDDYPIAFSVASPSPPPPGSTGTTARVSVNNAGVKGNGPSRAPALSPDGRFVAFASFATNLVPGDTNESPDVFIHDRQTGTIQRASVDSAGNQGDGYSDAPVLSADGRFVAFVSSATNLVPGDTNGWSDVFVHDRQTGTTQRVSVDSAGNQGDGNSDVPAISADGRFVAFVSSATNLVPGDTNGWWDVFVHDRVAGTTARVSVDSAGNQGDSYSDAPAISADGRFVAFDSFATNLVPGDTDGWLDVFVHDRVMGATERVSVNSAGNQGDRHSLFPSISADGRVVAFHSVASNLVPGDTNGYVDVFVHDRQTRTTERVSVDSAGNEGGADSASPALSADGRVVAFNSDATNLVPQDTNGVQDVFVHDRVTRTTERVSVDCVGGQGNRASGGFSAPTISADGGIVAFSSVASTLVPWDTDDQIENLFVRDRVQVEGDTTPAERTNGQPAGTLPAGTTQATLSLATNEPARCRYSITPGGTYWAMPAIFATTDGTAHHTPVGGLSDGGSYRVYVRCQDAAGNVNADDYSITFSVATSVVPGDTHAGGPR